MTLKDWRRVMGITQTQFSKDAGITQAAASKAESGKPLSVATIRAIHNATKGLVSFEDLVDGLDPKTA